MTAIEAAMDYVRKNLTGTFDTEIGPVNVDANAIKQSLSHSLYQNKLDATQAIGDVLTKDVYLGNAPDKDGKTIENYYFAAKVKIGDADKIVFIRSRKAEGMPNRFYVHEVFTEDEIKKLGSQQTAPRLSAMAHRNASEFYRTIIARVMNVKESADKSGKSTTYAIDGEIRETAKQRIRELAENGIQDMNEIIQIGRFLPAVIDILRNRLNLTDVNENTMLFMRGSELKHIIDGHPDLSLEEIVSLVDVFDHPSHLAYTKGNRGDRLWFLSHDNNFDRLGIAIYGKKKNLGWVKTFFKEKGGKIKKNIIEKGVYLEAVANSAVGSGISLLPGGQTGFISSSTTPFEKSISPQKDIVKRKKKESDQIPLSIQTEKIQRHKKSAEKSGNSPKSYAIDGVIRKIAKQRIR